MIQRRFEMETEKEDKTEFIEGRENIFADLGLPNPEEALAKAKLTQKINSILSKRKLSQSAAAQLLGIHQPRVSDLVNGKISKFTLDNLVHMLNMLDWDVVITTKHKPKSRGHALTLVAA